MDAADSRDTICSMLYPAARNDTAKALARLPAPTIDMRGVAGGFADMPGRIAESVVTLSAAGETPAGPPPGRRRYNRRPVNSDTTGCSCQFLARGQTPKAAPNYAVLYIVVMAKSARSKSKDGKSKTSSHSKVRVISSRVAYRGPVFWVTTDEVQEPGGVRTRRDIIHHTGSVVVLAVDESRSTPRVLLERQYRHAAEAYLWELPAGRIDPGEQALHAAQRELLEETGYTALRWRRILKFYASPGFVAETMSVYLATGLRAGTAQPEADEVIHKRMVSLPAAVGMVMKGTIRDAKTISSVLWLDHQRKKK
jgi:ADP-ribose pyrophosphatase